MIYEPGKCAWYQVLISKFGLQGKKVCVCVRACVCVRVGITIELRTLQKSDGC